jgi:hypothetical protein
MSDDFGRSLSDVMADVTMGYQGMSNTVSNFGITPPPALPRITDFVPPQVMAMYGASASAPFIPMQIPPPAPVMPYVPPMSVAPTSQYQAPQPAYQPAPMPFMQQPMMPPMQQPMMHAGSDPFGMQAALAQARSQQIMNASTAAYMDPSMMYPGAGMMTSHNMGVFRSQMLDRPSTAAPMGLGGVGPPLAMLPVSDLQRTREFSFSRPYDAALNQSLDMTRAQQQGYQSYADGAAKMALGHVGGLIGMGIGAVGGAAVGNPIAGSGIGAVAGEMLQFVPGADRAVAAVMRPALERRYDAIQTQYASRAYMLSSNADTDISGTGLSSSAAQRMTYGMDRLASSTNGDMNRKDITRLVQMSGEQGLLDFEQNSEQIIKATKNIMSLVSTMSQITGDPDFQANIQKIGKLRQLGMGMNKMDEALRNMEAYSRMAGVSVEEAMQTQGMQGAVTYQQLGLAGAQGLQAGVHALGATKQLMAAGTFNERDLAMYGGESGVAQMMTEVGGASISALSQYILPFLVDEGKGGRLSINKDRLRDLQTGKTTFHDALQAASGRTDLSQKAWQNLAGNQRRELTNALGDMSGPAGAQRMMFDMALTLSERNPNLDVQSILNMNVGEDAAAVLMRQTDKTYQKNIMAQMNKELERQQFEASQRTAPEFGFLARHGMRLPSPIDSMQRSWSDTIEGMEESAKLEAVGVRRAVREGMQTPGVSRKEALLYADKAVNEGSDKFSMFDEDLTYRDELMGRGTIRSFGARVIQGSYDHMAHDGNEALFGTGRYAMSNSRAGRSLGALRNYLDPSETDAAALDKLAGSYGKPLSSEDRAAARASLRAKIGDDAVLAKAQVTIGKKMASEVGMGITDPGMIALSDFREAVPGWDNLTEAEQRAFMDTAALAGGSKAEQYQTFHTEKALVANATKLGREFTGAGGGANANAALSAMFGGEIFKDVEIDDLNDSQRAAMEVMLMLTGDDASEQGYYLALAAALESTGGMKSIAQQLHKSLLETEGDAHISKLESARAKFKGLSKDHQEALMVQADRILNVPRVEDRVAVSNGRADITKLKAGALSKIGDTRQAAAFDNLLTSSREAAAVLQGAGANGEVAFKKDDNLKSHAARLQKATGVNAAALQKTMGASNFSKFQSLDLEKDEDMLTALDLLGDMGMGGGELDIKTKGVGATSEGITNQEIAIEAQSQFFSRLNASVDYNARALEDNTRALLGTNNKAKQAATKMVEDPNAPD